MTEETRRERDWKAAKARRIAAERGKPSLCYQGEFEQVAKHVTGLYEAGMSTYHIAYESGVVDNTSVLSLIKGYRGSRDEQNDPVTGVTRKTYEALMLVQFSDPREFSDRGARVSPVSTTRRLRALTAKGYTGKWIARQLDKRQAQVSRMISTPGLFVHWVTQEIVRELFEKYENVDPKDAGLSNHEISRAKGVARKHGYAPPICWDTDTIDDPDAFPEWTGACGTIHGYNLHRKLGIAMLPNDNGGLSVGCDPCCGARREARQMRDLEVVAKREALAEALAAGTPYSKIAADLGMSIRTVQRAARDLNGPAEDEKGSTADDVRGDE